MTYFNHVKVKKAERDHLIEEYKPKADYVKCKCSFAGTVAEFNIHMGRTRPSRNDIFADITKSRGDYPVNGSLLSYKGYQKT